MPMFEPRRFLGATDLDASLPGTSLAPDNLGLSRTFALFMKEMRDWKLQLLDPLATMSVHWNLQVKSSNAPGSARPISSDVLYGIVTLAVSRKFLLPLL